MDASASCDPGESAYAPGYCNRILLQQENTLKPVRVLGPGLRHPLEREAGHFSTIIEMIEAERPCLANAYPSMATGRVLLEQDRADQPGDRVLVGEDADDVGATLSLRR